ncbi:MAG: hypothetical protein GKR94_11130 [Gammaproteobacteria bacterium]|nr:hypothetical protein [Gammaproteobacteria bacterium]
MDIGLSKFFDRVNYGQRMTSLGRRSRIKAALGLAYLKQQGLFSLRDGWMACHHG